MKLQVRVAILLALCVVPAPFAFDRMQQSEGAGNAPANGRALTAAHAAWAEGDYIAALNRYIAILNAPGGDAHFAEIALQTGELYRSSELTTDGRNPRFSRDGRFLAFETGLEVSRRSKVLRNDGTFTVVADLPGV